MGASLILLMLYIKQGFPNKHTDIYINSIKQNFEPKNGKGQRVTTDPQKAFFAPTIDRILRKYETIDLQPKQERSNGRNLPIESHRSRQEDRKRWREIEREQYDSIKRQIIVSRSISHPPLHPSMKRSPGFPFHPRSHISLFQRPTKPVALREKALEGSWIDHLKMANKNQRESFLESNSGYLFPEVLAKLPRLAIFQREGDLSLARSMELKNTQEEDIFCSRQAKRSQIKLRAQRIEARRRRVVTIGEGGQGRIEPWRQATVISKSLF